MRTTKSTRSLKNKKAISPVIATVILVAVAVAIAIAVAFWAAGLAGTFTRFEKLEIQNIYSEAFDGTGWTAHFDIKNTGSTDATITSALVNAQPISAYSPAIVFTNTTDSLSPVEVSLPLGVPIANSCNYTLYIQTTAGFASGQTIEIKMTTASGTEYFKSVVLP